MPGSVTKPHALWSMLCMKPTRSGESWSFAVLIPFLVCPIVEVEPRDINGEISVRCITLRSVTSPFTCVMHRRCRKNWRIISVFLGDPVIVKTRVELGEGWSRMRQCCRCHRWRQKWNDNFALLIVLRIEKGSAHSKLLRAMIYVSLMHPDGKHMNTYIGLVEWIWAVCDVSKECRGSCLANWVEGGIVTVSQDVLSEARSISRGEIIRVLEEV